MGGKDPVSKAVNEVGNAAKGVGAVVGDFIDDTVGKDSYLGGGQAGKDIEAAGQKYIDAMVDPYKNLQQNQT